MVHIQEMQNFLFWNFKIALIDLGLHCNLPGLQIPCAYFLHTCIFSEKFLHTEAYKKPNGESILQYQVSFMLTVTERILFTPKNYQKKVKTRLYDLNTWWCWILILLFRLPMCRLHLHSKFQRQTQSSSSANLKTPLALTSPAELLYYWQ